MRFRVETPYWVRMPGAELGEHLEAVRRVLLEHERITKVTIDHRCKEGEITLSMIVDADDYLSAGHTEVTAVKSAVNAVGSPTAYKLWDFDGHTRINPYGPCDTGDQPPGNGAG